MTTIGLGYRRVSEVTRLGLVFTLGLACAPASQTPDADDSSPSDKSDKDSSTSETEPSPDESDPESENSTEPSEESSDGDEDPGDSETPDPDVKFDFLIPDDEDNSTDPGNDCDEVEHHPCDDASEDLFHALGVNCPGEVPQFEASFFGAPTSRGVRSSLGETDAFNPREGSRYLVLGSGLVDELGSETPNGDSDAVPTLCNDDVGRDWDVGGTLPAPLKTNRVGDVDCIEDPSLVGTGDCSNTIQAQWDAALGRANDYSELRLKVKVPMWANSLSYDFAFVTTEYPIFYGSAFNDIFIAWLESDTWTGNVSFDEMGNPISLNAGFLDYRDAEDGAWNDPECKEGCVAPELHGSCIKQHAGTKWLTTRFGVTPGEDIELVFAIMDLSDSKLDSYVLLDNLAWSCEEQDTPETDPPK